MSFDKKKIEELYPQAGELMWEPQLCWKLPKGKENQLMDVCESGNYFASIKKDGACYQVVRTQDFTYLFGRTISKTTKLLTEKIDNVPHLKEVFQTFLPKDTVLVAEIYYPGKTAKDVVSIMGCLLPLAIKRQQKQGPIHAYIHDILYYDGVDLRNEGALARYQILEKVWEKHELYKFDFLELALPIYDNIFEAAEEALAAGEEGLVLRKKDAPWTCGKRPAWTTIKVKQTDSIDLVCVNTVPATIEYTGIELENWPYWEVGTPTFYQPLFKLKEEFSEWKWEKVEGKLYEQYQFQQCHYPELIKGLNVDLNSSVCRPVTKLHFFNMPGAIEIGAYDDKGELKKLGTVSSGFTDKDRQDMRDYPDNHIGSVVALGCMSIDYEEKTLRHPVFRSWRFDKDASDCKISEIFSGK